MGKKAAKRRAKKKTEDIEVLFPERELTLRDEQVTVNELSFMQTLKLGARPLPLITALGEFIGQEGGGEDLVALAGVFAEHEAIFSEMLRLSVGKDQAWLDTLTDDEGFNLLLTFWSVNQSFFINRLTAQVISKGPPTASVMSGPH